MPAEQVMHKFKHGILHSGSKNGPKVKSRKQAQAILMSEKAAGKSEYKSKTKDKKKTINVEPSNNLKSKYGMKD